MIRWSESTKFTLRQKGTPNILNDSFPHREPNQMNCENPRAFVPSSRDQERGFSRGLALQFSKLCKGVANQLSKYQMYSSFRAPLVFGMDMIALVFTNKSTHLEPSKSIDSLSMTSLHFAKKFCADS